MGIRYTDLEISQLLAENKPLPRDYQARLFQMKSHQHGIRRGQLHIRTQSDHEFYIFTRQTQFNPLDFSIILGIQMPATTDIFRLRRHNGKSHEHRNPLENQVFYGFHIHRATERYQGFGFGEEDKFAEPTDRYSDFTSAWNCFMTDCNCRLPDNAQLELGLMPEKEPS